METIILKPKNKKQSFAIIEFAKKNGLISEIVTNKKAISEPKITKAKLIMQLSKKVNKSGTKKAFKQLGLNYDSYCR